MKVQALRGFRDYLPAEMLAKSRMLARITAVFESFGYPPLATPALEYSEVLLGKYGAEGDMLMYRFRDNGDRDVCMRYDLTVPLARVIAEHADLPMPFRRYQIAPVWRAEKPGRGRYREFVQCDADLVGSEDAAADGEILMLGAALIATLGIERFEIRVNHRGVLRGLTRALGLIDGEREGAFLRLLDKIEKIGRDEFAREAAAELGLDASAIERLFEWIGSREENADAARVLKRLQAAFGADADGARGLERLREIAELFDRCGLGARLRIDPSIARGLAYYTGLIYETVLDDLPAIGSVMSGGRYDDLVGIFARRALPAVGISLGIDRLFAALEELSAVRLEASPARVLVTLFDAAGRADSFRFAAALRARGIAAALYPGPAKLKKQLQYADTLGIPYCAILGSEEAALGKVTLKDLRSGEQSVLGWEDAARKVLGSA